MKFLNYKDPEKTLRAASRMKEVRFGNQRVSLFPDLAAETRQHQQLRWSQNPALGREYSLRHALPSSPDHHTW